MKCTNSGGPEFLNHRNCRFSTSGHVEVTRTRFVCLLAIKILKTGKTCEIMVFQNLGNRQQRTGIQGEEG